MLKKTLTSNLSSKIACQKMCNNTAVSDFINIIKTTFCFSIDFYQALNSMDSHKAWNKDEAVN